MSEIFDLRYTNLRRFKAHSLHLTPPAGKLRKGYEVQRVSHNYKEIKEKKFASVKKCHSLAWLVLFELDFFLIQRGREESQLIANAEEISRTEKIIAILKRFQLEICTTPYSTHFQGQEKEAGCCFI